MLAMALPIRLSVLAGAAAILAWPAAADSTERVSVGNGGVQANGQSFQLVISGNGRFVVFNSQATNLVTGDTNGVNDLFIRDRKAGTTKRVSIGSGGDGGGLQRL